MSLKKIEIWITTSMLFCGVVVADRSNAVRRCFQFTWVGPRYNNENVLTNGTCDKVTRLAGKIPCRHPLVISHDGTWPNVEYIWTQYGKQASCVASGNDVCAQFTYYYDGHVENSTYMCTRGMSNDQTSVNSGCHEQRNGSFITRVCFCRSVLGGVPCNDTTRTTVSYLIYSFAFLFLLIFQRLFLIVTNT